MKKCPQCEQVFADEYSFCLEDGTTLLNASNFNTAPVAGPTAEIKGDETETQIIPNPTDSLSQNTADTATRNTGTSGGKFVYALVGAMAVIILILAGAVVYFLAWGQGDSNETGSGNIGKNEIGSNSAKTKEVRDLIARWEKAQDAQNYADYKSCYGKPFRGIKRTDKGKKSYDYDGWLADRRRMLGRAVSLDVEVKNLKISFEGDVAKAEFEQFYRSKNYSDRGTKVLEIKFFAEEPKIVYEELKNSIPLKN